MDILRHKINRHQLGNSVVPSRGDGTQKQKTLGNRYEGQPEGRAGDVWAAQMVRRAFPDLLFVPDLSFHSEMAHRGRRWAGLLAPASNTKRVRRAASNRKTR